jgi:kynurenine formamidase
MLVGNRLDESPAQRRPRAKEAIMCVPGCQEVVHSTLSRRGFFAGAAAVGFAAAMVEPAQAAPRHFKSVVDLTHTMSPEFPTFFGVPGIELQKQFDFKKDGFNLNWWRIIEHAGTHLDAPIHFSEGGSTADKIMAGDLVVPLAVIDVRKQAAQSPDYVVTRQDIAAWEKKNKKLPNGCCVAMLSGWGQYVTDAAKFTGKDASGAFHFPGFSPEVAEFLLKERKVAGIAVDTLSLDHGASKDFKVHTTWLPSGRWGLENVANLDKVPAAGATLVVGIAKVKDATGGPARLIALI